MADAERREARKRKLLQNSEDRLQRILGSRSSHLTTLKSKHQPSDIVLNSTSAEKDVSNQNKFDVATKESETIVRGKDVSPLIEDEDNETVQNIKAEETACESKDVVTDGGNYLDEEFKDVPEVTSCHQDLDLPPSEVNKTVEHLPCSSNSGIWTRVIFNIILAIVLVGKWTFVNLEVLLSVNRNQDRGSSQSGLIQSESMIWPFLALQLLFVCVPSFRQTSHSVFISMLTVALQLCGIPIEFTHKVNFILTALLAALKDFGVFLFAVIVAHCIVDYTITSGLLVHVLKTVHSS